MVTMATTIPAISGAETKYFDVMFWNGVTEKRQEAAALLPIRGSIGVFWQLYQDLTVIGTDSLEKQRVNKIYPRKPEDGIPMTAMNARALKAFFNFAQQTEQPFFFIKKGTQPLWLVRKTSAYYYDDRPDEPYWFPHRIQFEFVRLAEGTETAKRLGKGMNTMMEIEVFTPLPKPTPLPLVVMPQKKVRLVKTPVKSTVIETAYQETEEEPLDISTTEIIKVQSFEHEGTHYYREPIKNKLYAKKGNGGVGAYVGRWSPKDLALHTEIPDSDRED
jgi:hypothetical protein